MGARGERRAGPLAVPEPRPAGLPVAPGFPASAVPVDFLDHRVRLNQRRIARVVHRMMFLQPRQPFVPAGAPGELRLDATKEQVIPAYPY